MSNLRNFRYITEGSWRSGNDVSFRVERDNVRDVGSGGGRVYISFSDTQVKAIRLNKDQIDDLVAVLLYFRDHELEEGET